MAAGALTVSLLGQNAADARPHPVDTQSMATTLSLPSPPGGANVKVLVFHASATDESPTVDAGIAAIEKIGLTGPEAGRFRTVATDDPAVFTNGKQLGKYNAVVFLTGGGDVLDPEQEAGLEAYMEAAVASSASMTRLAPNRTRTGSPAWSAPVRQPTAQAPYSGPRLRSGTGSTRRRRTCRWSGSAPTGG